MGLQISGALPWSADGGECGCPVRGDSLLGDVQLDSARAHGLVKLVFDCVFGVRGALLDDDTYGQVWLLGEHPIGYAIITWSWSLESGGKDCILDEIYVAQQGNGLGAHLLTEVITHARSAGAAAIFLETESANDRARRFYQRHGFEIENSTWLSRIL